MFKFIFKIKNLIVFVSLLTIASCSAFKKDQKLNQPDQTQIVDQEVKEPYEPITNVEEAQAIDQQTQEEVEEIEVKDRVFFGYDSADLSSDAKAILDVQASWLKSDSAIEVTIEGHCDQRGTREYNIALGEKRANSAKNYLIDQGVSENRIKVISYGKERPAFFGTSSDVMSKNRRAVTVIN
jgi:peptidoglycan-associated lipoprotein